MMMSKLIEDLKKDEGLMLKPYLCSAGKLTIGYGRNIEDKGISKQEAMIMLKNDIKECELQCKNAFWFYNNLNVVRQNILINMCFNLGIEGLKKFKRFLGYLEVNDYSNAAVEMLDSKWAKQVGIRAIRLAKEMETGTFSK
jgi:lysozyme